MKNWLLVIAVVLFFTLGSGTGWSIENSAIRNPVGLSTVPPSSIQSGLIDSPNPIDTGGNLVITGNVRRGRHFRGTVPYQSATSFRAALGSARLESFLRDSAGAEEFGRYAGKYRARPYYSPTETVTTTRPGRSGVFKPAGTRISSRAPDVFGLEPLPQTQALSRRGTSTSDIRLWGPQTQYSALREPRSLSLSPQEIEQLARRELDIYQRGEKLDRTAGIRKQYLNQTEATTNAIKAVWEPELLRHGLKQMGDEAAELEQSLAERDDSLRRFPEGGVSERAWSAEGGFVMQAPEGQMKETSARRSGLPASGFRGDEFSAARDSAFKEGSILWGPPNAPGSAGLDHTRLRRVTFAEPLQKAPKWEGEPKVDEGIAEPGKGDTGLLRTVRALQEQGQGDGVPNANERVARPDVLERIRQQLDDLAKSVDARLQTEPDDSREAGPLYGPEEAADGEMEVSEDELYFDEMLREVGTQESSRERSFALDGLDELSQADRPKAGMIQSGASLWSARAKRIMGPHKSLESFSEAKFNQHMRAAESYLRQGMYYRAADSFTLASIYKVGDPRSLAGRSHALFAAGEYISSALFLSRALEIDPEYARTEIDFVTMLGGMGKLQSRIAEVKEWLERSGAGELQFLLGYVYYRIGKLQEAKEAIDIAYEKIHRSPPVGAVKKAVDDAIAGQ